LQKNKVWRLHPSPLHHQSAEGPAMIQQKTQYQYYEKSTGKSAEKPEDFLPPCVGPQRQYVELLASDNERPSGPD
jgi:hypothetical protein